MITPNDDFERYRCSYDLIAKDDIENEFEKAKYRRIIPFSKFIRSKDTDKVLEVGVARGFLLNLLRGEKVGIDIAQEYIDKFKGDYVGICCPIESIPFPDGYFDVIIADSVLEHVLDLEVCLKEIYRVLKPNGRFYALFPLDEDLTKYDWEVKKYGLREHLRTFHEPVQLPFFSIVKTKKTLPMIPTNIGKYLTLSRLHRIIHKVVYPLPSKGVVDCFPGYDSKEIKITLFLDYLLLHVLHYKAISIMVEAVKL